MKKPCKVLIFRPETIQLILIIALAIFILGVQIGIKHGRDLQKQDFQEQYAIDFAD